jgi:TolB protein
VKILDGGRVVTIPAVGASALSWSPDGETLAYLDGQLGRLWLARLDGHSRPLLNAPVRSFAWSPAGHGIAIEPDAGGLLLVTLSGQTATLVGPDSLVTSMEWAPDGHTLAYAQALPPKNAEPALRTDRLYLRDVTASTPTRVPYSPAAGDGIILGGWWPNERGLYLWPDPLHSASIAADGLDLLSVALPEAKVVSLGTTLPTPRVLAFSPDGSQVVVMTGGFRFIGQNKTLERCFVGSNQCTPIPQPAGSVSVAPSWSPDGRSIAFVRGGSSDNPNSAWLPTTELVLLAVRTGAAPPIAAAIRGVGDPGFSADSAHLVFQHDTGLWLLDVATGATRQLTDGLVPLATQWPSAPAYAWHR